MVIAVWAGCIAKYDTICATEDPPDQSGVDQLPQQWLVSPPMLAMEDICKVCHVMHRYIGLCAVPTVATSQLLTLMQAPDAPDHKLSTHIVTLQCLNFIMDDFTAQANNGCRSR
jgi:hypothetical protein